MSEKHERLSIKIHPLQGDDNDLSVSSFLATIEGFKKAAGCFSSKDLKIVEITKNSPVTITLEDETHGLRLLYDGMCEFMRDKVIPAHWGRSLIDSVVGLLSPVGRSISKFYLLGNQDEEIKLDISYKVDFQNQIGKDYFAYGTVDGMLEAVNIHGKKNALTLYPVVGKNKITCDFSESKFDEVRRLIGSYVEVSGEMKYLWRAKHPTHVKVDKITLIEEDHLPTFADLYGMAPNATKGVPSEDFIARIRGEWK